MEPVTQRNPALESLAVLIGDWTMELSNASFLPSPAETMIGSASFAWIEDGALVAFYQGEKRSAVPDARWIIGRDDGGDVYTVLYFDTRGVSRVYSMRFDGSKWELWRNAPGFSQRFSAHVSEDQNTITGSWQKSVDGTNWEHDFDVSYRRAADG